MDINYYDELSDNLATILQKHICKNELSIKRSTIIKEFKAHDFRGAHLIGCIMELFNHYHPSVLEIDVGVKKPNSKGKFFTDCNMTYILSSNIGNYLDVLPKYTNMSQIYSRMKSKASMLILNSKVTNKDNLKDYRFGIDILYWYPVLIDESFTVYNDGNQSKEYLVICLKRGSSTKRNFLNNTVQYFLDEKYILLYPSLIDMLFELIYSKPTISRDKRRYNRASIQGRCWICGKVIEEERRGKRLCVEDAKVSSFKKRLSYHLQKGIQLV